MPLFNYSKWLPLIGEKLVLAKYVLYVSVPIWLLVGVCYATLFSADQQISPEPDAPASAAETIVVVAVILSFMVPYIMVQTGIMMLIATKSIKVSPYAVIPEMRPMIDALRIEKNISLTKAQTRSYYIFCAAMVIAIYLLNWIKAPPQ